MNFQFTSYKRSHDFSNLPTEIILKILSFLNLGDQGAVSLTCRRWFEASEQYFAKLKLTFFKVCISDDSYPGELFINTNRPYNNLELVDVVLCQPNQFFEKLGESLTKVSFISLDINEKQLCCILRELQYLSDLTIESASPLFMSGKFLESLENRNSVAEIISKLKYLSLQNNAYLSDAIIMRIMDIIEELYSLNLSGCHITCHNAIQKRFYPQHFENIPSESLLTLKYVLKAIETQASSLEELDLSDTLIDGEALSSISSIHNLNLKKITLKLCRQLNLNGISGFVNKQSNIKAIDLSHSEGVNDLFIEQLTILSNLEELRLRFCRKLTDNTTKVLNKFKKLKILDLSRCVCITNNGITDLMKEKNEKLIELHLTAIDLYEDCIIKCAENLPNLNIFGIGHCCNGVTDKSLRAIIKNQRLIRNLNLESCHLITDAAITGCNVDGFEIMLNEEVVLKKEEKNILSSMPKPMKISLRSKAEQQIVEEANRAKTMVSLLNKNIDIEVDKNNISLSALKGLEILNLSGCTKISDISLKYGLKFCELRKLNISNCQQISFRGIECLIVNCCSIEELDLSYCRNLNQQAVDIVQENLKRLRILNLVGCSLD